jgi:tRNA 2-thiouridine synthesizing protein A
MTSSDPDSTPAVLAEVERGIGVPCRDCGRPVCGHEVMMSFVLGFKGTPLCLACLASGLERDAGSFVREVREHIDHRECWRAGWRRADELEGSARGATPACLLGSRGDGVSTPRDRGGDARAAPRFDAEWDAGDLGCGDLVLELRFRFQSMKGGQVLRLTARDPGAPEDLPAWCTLTGHALLHAAPPTWFIQRRKE